MFEMHVSFKCLNKHSLLVQLFSRLELVGRAVNKEHRCVSYPGVVPSLGRLFPLSRYSRFTMAEAAAAPQSLSPVAETNTTVSTLIPTAEKAADTGKRKSSGAEPSGRSKRRRGAGGKKLPAGERYVPPPQKRNPSVSFSQEHFNETTYYYEGGLRKVRPYYFDFKTYCKGRWVGKSLKDVFESEFRVESIEYYEEAVKEGRIRLNDTPVDDLSVVLKVSVSRAPQRFIITTNATLETLESFKWFKTHQEKQLFISREKFPQESPKGFHED